MLNPDGESAYLEGLAHTDDPLPYDCRPMTKADELLACCKIYPGAWSWCLGNIRPIKPFPVSGSLGLFEVEVAND